jgi:hypothetical protein
MAAKSLPAGTLASPRILAPHATSSPLGVAQAGEEIKQISSAASSVFRVVMRVFPVERTPDGS